MWHRWTVVIERGQRRFKSPVLLSPLLSLLPNSGPERLARRCGLLLASPFFPLRPAFLAFWSSTSRPIYKFTLLLLSFHGPVVTMCVCTRTLITREGWRGIGTEPHHYLEFVVLRAGKC